MRNRFIKIGSVLGIIILFLGASLIPSTGATTEEKHVRLTINRDTLYYSEGGSDIYSIAAKFIDNMNNPVESKVVLSLSPNGNAYNGQIIYGTIEHDGVQREYILYIPDSYTENEPMPLVFNFHGYTSSAESQMNYADFRPIADTAGFLIVHPQGTIDDLGNTYWNVGGFWHPGGTADDVGFTDVLINSLAFNYSINITRIYATGMSNGGFFSFHLAGQLSDRFAAVAPVAGTMTPYTYDNYDPQHPTPILQIHGTADYLVPYDGTTWSLSVDSVLDYWVNYNNCNPDPIITELPDLDPSDGSTVTHIVYEDGDNGVTVEHFRVNGGGHDWPGSNYGGNQDIDACFEIWQFFTNYSLDTFYVDANGPYQGFTQEEIQFEGYANNGVLPYQWHWDFGDGLISNEQNPTHSYESSGNYTVGLTVEDAEDNIVHDITWALIEDCPTPPTPFITGPTSGKPGIEYDYMINCSNPSGGAYYLWIDWGDETTTDWIGPYSSDISIIERHSWAKKGFYIIKAKAKYICGEGDWGTLEVNIPRNRVSIGSFWLRFFDMFPILQRILEMIN